ncbi:MAG: KGK domain-containing protein [Halothece sp.]
MTNSYYNLSKNDVVFFEKQKNNLCAKTFKVSDFINWIFGVLKIGAKPQNNNQEEEIAKFTGKGIPCHVLQPGQNWKKGKIRIAIEFIPDESESPLDDVRQDNSNHEE